VEALDHKRRRLRRELQVAYGAWLTASDIPSAPDACYAPATRMKWAAYLAARERLVMARAELSAGHPA